MPNRQGPNGIDWCHYTWNPLHGECLNDAPCKEYCYMERMYRQHPELRHPIELNEKELSWNPGKPCIVFAESRLEFLHPAMNRTWQEAVIEHMGRNRHVNYVILSKLPERYSQFNWPRNCWLGTTVDGLPHTADNVYKLMTNVRPDYVRFVSYEPLLREPNASWLLPLPPPTMTYVPEQLGTLDWIIIGADSNRGAEQPPTRWARTLAVNARSMGIKVFVKANYKTYSQARKDNEMPGNWYIDREGKIRQRREAQLELF